LRALAGGALARGLWNEMSPPAKSGGRTKRRGAGRGGVEKGAMVPSPFAGAHALLGVSRSLKRTLAFTKYYTASIAASTYAESTLYLNSAHNVDTAVDAVGFGKYMAFFSKCFVVGGSVRVHAMSAGGQPVVHGVTVSTLTTSLGTQNAAIENGMCDWASTYTSPDTCVLTQRVNTSRFLTKPKVLDDPQLFCTLAALPSQLIVAHVWATNFGGSAVTVDQMCEVLLECVFTDPIPFT